MILHELTKSEDDSRYGALEISNSRRYLSFLESTVAATLSVNRPFLSQTLIKAINYHAIACLHIFAGEYRPCQVYVGDPEDEDSVFDPPEHYRVAPLMDDFVNVVNREWGISHPVDLATFVLWRLNYIHPFINGNGRTARAACYFVLCVSSGGWLPGRPILPALLNRQRDECIAALKVADKSGETSLLRGIIVRLLNEQLDGA